MELYKEYIFLYKYFVAQVIQSCHILINFAEIGLFRLEKLNWENKSSQAKSLGTFVSIGGAFVVTFYKGPPLIGELSHSGSPRRLLLSPQLSWILGGFFLAAEAFMSSAWYILQVWPFNFLFYKAQGVVKSTY